MKELTVLINKLSTINDKLAASESLGVNRAKSIMIVCDLIKDICLNYLKRRKCI